MNKFMNSLLINNNAQRILLTLLMMGISACTAKAEMEPISDTNALVYKETGRVQCFDGAVGLEAAQTPLASQNIIVSDAFCGVKTGVMYPAVCGGATPDIYLFSIPVSQLQLAQSLGFTPVASENKMTSYQKRECNQQFQANSKTRPTNNI
jgi:hypothetical protein